MGGELKGKTIAILVADGFEQVELTEPRKALEDAGATTSIVSLRSGQVEGWNHFDKGDTFAVDATIVDARASAYDALLLPGGVANPDQLRANERAVAFVRAFSDAGKPIASICHGPWMLIEAGLVDGKRITSWPTLRTDLRNAGARWIDDEVVVDGGIVTSRNPDDIPAFNREMIKLFAQSDQARTR